MLRKELLEQLQHLGYATHILSNGVDAMVKFKDDWYIIEDTIEDVPLVFSEDDDVYQLMTRYTQTPKDARGVIYQGSTYRIVDAVYDIRELGFNVSFHEQRLVIYKEDCWYLQIKPAERVWVKSQRLETLQYELRQALVDTVYKLLATPVLLRFWDFNDEERLVLDIYPQVKWVTRDETTGGIELHIERPTYQDNHFISDNSILLPYDPELFLKINYSQNPYKI